MASPPFNIAETIPTKTSLVSDFPTPEQTFRDVVESWLKVEHDTYGHHTLPSDTTTNRDADTHWSAGSLFFNTTLKCFQICTNAPSDWWAPGFPGSTNLTFEQSLAPDGWTKKTDSGYNNVSIRGVTGTPSSGGTADFTDVLKTWTIAQANLPSVNFTVTLDAAGAHFHQYGGPTGTTNIAGGANNPSMIKGVEGRATSAAGGHTHTGTAASGGSGAALDFAVKYRDVIFASKDDPAF